LAAVLTVFACTSSWADKNVQAPKPSDLVKTAAVTTPGATFSPVTTFVDGPTGYVFVYTVEGWKFVPATKN
jgi:hypothetical protein